MKRVDPLYQAMMSAMHEWVLIKKAGGKSKRALNQLRLARWNYIQAKGQSK